MFAPAVAMCNDLNLAVLAYTYLLSAWVLLPVYLSPCGPKLAVTASLGELYSIL